MSVRTIPRLHLVGPLGILPVKQYPGIARAAAQGGCDAVHVRMPGAKGGDVLELALLVKAALGEVRRTSIIVNDRVDAAQVARAEGVQLGERSLSVADARAILGTEVLVARSIHDAAGAVAAERAGADFILAGHVFETDSKAGQPGRGLGWLTDICTAVSIPVIAIGGINAKRVAEVMRAGAHGVAVGREILCALDSSAAAKQIRDQIEGNTACNAARPPR